MKRLTLACRARIACASAALSLLVGAAAVAEPLPADFPTLPLPPSITELVGLSALYTGGRREYLGLITRAAEQAGLPPAVADAVAHVESRYRPGAVGGVGEIGLMQLRPQTAAMLGHTGGVTALFEPEVNIRYGVMYLARAWRLADGDLCRALMKYRAGWGEEHISPLSAEYCRRARQHLASIGSPLADGMQAPVHVTGDAFAAKIPKPTPRPTAPATIPTAAPVKVASVEPPGRPQALALAAMRAPVKAAKIKLASAGDLRAIPPVPPVDTRKMKLRRQMWAEHDARMNRITARFSSAQLRISGGI